MSDLIDRQQAIDALNNILANYVPYLHGITECIPLDCAVAIKTMPSAQPERKKGKWIWWYEEEFTEHATEYTPHCKCSECGRECAPSVATYSNFCRNCGADMRGESDES